MSQGFKNENGRRISRPRLHSFTGSFAHNEILQLIRHLREVRVDGVEGLRLAAVAAAAARRRARGLRGPVPRPGEQRLVQRLRLPAVAVQRVAEGEEPARPADRDALRRARRRQLRVRRPVPVRQPERLRCVPVR